MDGSTTYTYDALNQRVLATVNGTTRAYGFNAAGQRSTVWDGSGNLLSAQYYVGGQPLGYWLASDGHVRFQHQDWVSTERFRTTYTGTVEGSFTSLPFGDSTATASGSDTDPSHYAGLDADATDLHHADFRQYSSLQGRWLRPDPYDGSYDIADPQSLNRYAYVGNSPMTGADPSGLVRPPAIIDNDGLGLTIFGGSGGYSLNNTTCFGYSYYTSANDGMGYDSGNVFDSSDIALSSCVGGLFGFGGVANNGVLGPHAPPESPSKDEGKKNAFLCGSEAAANISAAAALHHISGLKSGVGGFIADAVGGNPFSGLTDLVHSFATGEGGGHGLGYNMGQSLVAGPTQGFGAAFGKLIEGTPFASGPVDAALAAVLGEYATGVGEAKLIYDGVTYVGAVGGCLAGIIR